MVRPKRFELLTPWFVAKYSIQLSYGRMRDIIRDTACFLKLKLGGERGIRTLDTDLSPYASLAGKCLRPLGQLSVLNQLRFIARARYYLIRPYKSIKNRLN
jgi:hypothetical protein